MEIVMRDGVIVVAWELSAYTVAVNTEIKNRLHRIAGVEYDGRQKVWTVPAAQADRLYAAFPKASYDYDVICAVVDAQVGRCAIFYRSLVGMGVRLVCDDSGAIVAVGDGVSPLLQAAVDERSEELRPMVQAEQAAWLENSGQIGFADALQVQFTINEITSDSRAVSAVSAETLRQAEILINGMRNAVQNQYEAEAARQRRSRRRKSKTKQAAAEPA